jgi:hypothetical protein
MRSTAVWALAALNVMLLVLLVWRGTGDNAAMAQAGRPGDYLMIPGEVVGGTDAVVYIVDQSSHQLSAMQYDDSMHKLNTMPAMSLDRVFAEVGGAGGAAGGRRQAR